MDQTELILVVPNWPTQPWFNPFQGMLSQQPYVVTPQKKNLILPQKTETNTSDRENLREVFLSQGFDNDTVDILITSWKKAFSPTTLHI